MSTPENKKSSNVQHIRLANMPTEHLNPLFDRQFVAGEKSMLARLVLRAGCVVPLHSHQNEQITYILEGALKFSVQGKEFIVSAGEIMVIPADVPHSAEALEDTVDLDLFCPPRADWIRGSNAHLANDRVDRNYLHRAGGGPAPNVADIARDSGTSGAFSAKP